MTKTITLQINDKAITVPEGTTVLQACQDANVEVPVFCYHQRLAVAGNCRMCLVEVEKMPKPVASCAMPATEGMVVKTNSPMVEKARQGVLEFLLINHPLDCPICDQGGECDLQDITMNYSRGHSRFELNKRAVLEKYMGPLIKTTMTRCIHCTRCVRFANEIAGVAEIGAIHRGEHTEITTLEQAITSELSGNLADVCPVGALTSKPYAFHGRPWELTKTPSIDVMDAVGSHIRIDTKGAKVMRILPALCEDINEEWISDKTRFACDGLAHQRIDTPYIRLNGKLEACSWEAAFDAIITASKNIAPTQMAALTGNQVDLESTFALKELLNKLNVPHYDCRPKGATFTPKDPSHILFNTTIAGIEDADLILLVGTNPRIEATLINARIRKRHLLGNLSIFSFNSQQFDLTYPYHFLGDDLNALTDDTSSNNSVTQHLHQAFKNCQKPMVIIGDAVMTHPNCQDILSTITNLLKPFENNVQKWNPYNWLHSHTGPVGALLLDFLPKDSGYDTNQIYQNCKTGDLKLIFLHGVDDFTPQDLENTFKVYIGHHGDLGAHHANVILPSAAYSEKEATYVNTEGRVQRTNACTPPPGHAKEDWDIITALALSYKLDLGFREKKTLRMKLYEQYPLLSRLGALPHLPYRPLVGREHPNTTNLSTPFIYPIENYYMTCVISRHSPTMANCCKEIQAHTPKECAS